MTVSIAWVRRIRDCEELVFVSDSRLSGDGREIDCCAKLMTLPRSDCAISFAGYTGDAYPLMHHLSLAISAHAPLSRRTLDLPAVKSHALKIFDSVADSIANASPGADEPDSTFLFGGYSWVKKAFELWTISYSASEGHFIATPAQCAMTNPMARRVFYGYDPTNQMVLGKIAFGGDQGREAKRRLSALVDAELPGRLERKEDISLDMEPFKVVRDMLRDPNKSATIGGPPQVVKVYQYQSSAPLGIFWPNAASQQASLLGRPLLGYERIDHWVLDPDTLRSQPWTPTSDLEDELTN